MKRLVIIGGGYAGTALARALDASFEVTLVEPREAFVHNVAAIRALVDPGLIPRIVLPYDKLLARGRVVRGRAIGVAEGAVDLDTGAQLLADYVVLATGSTYAAPFKPSEDAMSAFREAQAALSAKIRDAKTLAIVGAGAVGVELAGEIASTLKGKAITLISAERTLFPGFAPGLGSRLLRELKALGVSVKLGAKAESAPGSGAVMSGGTTLDTGETVTADLTIRTTGAVPTTGILAGVATAAFDGVGRVKTDGWMRPAGLRRVFALGDMAANGDLMTIVAASRQAPWLAKTLTALAAGREIEALPPYAPWSAPPILVPLGPKAGASVLPVTTSGLVVGAFLTAAIKGKALFIPRYHKEFGL